jgi:hypothetical protein
MTSAATEAPLVLSLIGQNANGALATATQATSLFWQSYGYASAVIDLHHPDSSQQILQQVRTRRPAFVTSLAGIGASLSHQGVNLWDILQLPFLSMLFDHPCYLPERHKINSRYVANCYYCHDFYQVQRQHIQSQQACFQLSPDFPGHSAGRTTAWAERDIPLLFAKSGGASQALLAGWHANLPKPLTDFLLDCAALLQTDRRQLITTQVQAALPNLPPDVQQTPDIFWKITRTLDTYIRRWRAEQLVEWIKHIPGTVIIGDDWKHIDRHGAAATFLPAMPAADLWELYPRAKVVANSNPYFRHGVHERVVTALRSGAAVLTDANDFSDTHLATMRNVCAFEWPTLGEDIMATVRSLINTDMREATAESCALLNQELSDVRLIAEIESVVQEMVTQSYVVGDA